MVGRHHRSGSGLYPLLLRPVRGGQRKREPSVRKTIVRVTSLSIALILALAACGSDSEETTAEAGLTDSSAASDGADAAGTDKADKTQGGADEDAAEPNGNADNANNGGSGDNPTTSTSTAVATTSTTQSGANDGANGAANGELGPFLTFAFDQAGVEVTDEILSCVSERDVDVALGLAATEQQIAEATLAAFTCAPEQAGAFAASQTPAPAGTDADDVECVAVEIFRQLGELPVDEAIAALESDEIPEDFRAVVVPATASACELSEDEVQAILDS